MPLQTLIGCCGCAGVRKEINTKRIKEANVSVPAGALISAHRDTQGTEQRVRRFAGIAACARRLPFSKDIIICHVPPHLLLQLLSYSRVGSGLFPGVRSISSVRSCCEPNVAECTKYLRQVQLLQLLSANSPSFRDRGIVAFDSPRGYPETAERKPSSSLLRSSARSLVVSLLSWNLYAPLFCVHATKRCSRTYRIFPTESLTQHVHEAATLGELRVYLLHAHNPPRGAFRCDVAHSTAAWNSDLEASLRDRCAPGMGARISGSYKERKRCNRTPPKVCVMEKLPEMFA